MAHIQAQERQRLDSEPLHRRRIPNSDISTLIYKDTLLKASCLLTYWFDMDSLQVVTYSCSNPDWSEEELKKVVSRKLSSVYGNAIAMMSGNRKYEYFPAENSHTYFRLVRIAQDRESWRTFQANIFISHYAHLDYPLLADLLLKFGAD